VDILKKRWPPCILRRLFVFANITRALGAQRASFRSFIQPLSQNTSAHDKIGMAAPVDDTPPPVFAAAPAQDWAAVDRGERPAIITASSASKEGEESESEGGDRCARCARLLDDNKKEEGPCRFHPGKPTPLMRVTFQDFGDRVRSVQHRAVRWDCCDSWFYSMDAKLRSESVDSLGNPWDEHLHRDASGDLIVEFGFGCQELPAHEPLSARAVKSAGKTS
jgi:hypothetical protein